MGRTITHVNFSPESIEVTFIEDGEPDPMFQEVKFWEINRSLLRAGAVESIQDDINDLLEDAYVARRHPVDTFQAPRQP